MIQELIDEIVSVVSQETLGIWCHGKTCIIITVSARASMKNNSRFVDPNLLF